MQKFLKNTQTVSTANPRKIKFLQNSENFFLVQERINCLVLAKVGRRKKDGSNNPGFDREPSGRDKAEQLAYRHTDRKNKFCCHLENSDFIG